MKRIKLKLIYIPIALSILLCVFMLGITDYISAGFTFKNLAKVDFWINLTFTTIGNISIILAIILINVDKYKTHDELYLTMLNNIIKFRKERYVAPLFVKYCNEINRKNKIIYYKNQIENKFSKLKPTPKDIQIYDSGTEEEKKNNKYCLKVAYYNYLLNDKYINENIDKLKINYPIVSPSLIFSGYKDNDSIIEYVTRHKTKKVVIDYLPKFLLSFSLTILLASMAPTLKENISIATIMSTVVRLFLICIQIYFANDYSQRYNIEVTLHDIQFRESQINEYIVWEDKQISNLKNNEEKEITNNGERVNELSETN